MDSTVSGTHGSVVSVRSRCLLGSLAVEEQSGLAREVSMTWMDSAAIFAALLCQYECANSVDTADGYAMLASLTACATAHPPVLSCYHSSV